MITSYLQGGLGNQLFQISAAISLALDMGTEPVFDIKNHDLPKQGRRCDKYLETIFRNIKFSSNLSIKQVYHEPHFHYKKIDPAPNMCLVGYFQSEKYFQKHADYIREAFSIDGKTEEVINKKYGSILKNAPVAVHVRRGDYLQLIDAHPPCSVEYYEKAMASFPDGTTFLMFSDDISWCKENFLRDNVVFIEKNEDIIDFYLIYMCNDVILSNSSFSWWAAWLNNNENKRIIAPRRWFGKAMAHNTRDLIPNQWEMM
tara:strand:+ start:4828 stop:5601 length:774 start_codon:yes stop_codon:yes gene_type:complete